MSITLRNTTGKDAADCGRIVFDAFGEIARQHNFPLDFPAREMADGLMKEWTAHPQIFGMLAEENGVTLGCNFLDQRNPIGGVGPMVVDPDAQGRGIGKLLMRAIVERGQSMRGVRLVQDAFNTTSMSLYASLGFEVREPLSLVRGKCRLTTSPFPGTPGEGRGEGGRVRPMTHDDLPRCNQLCQRAHGFHRGGELADALKMFNPHVLERNGKIVAYASAPWLWVLNHAVADNMSDLQALLAGVSAIGDEPISMLIPARDAELFRWCLSQGLRVIKPMTLMTMGWYQQPELPYFPSVLY